MAIIAAPPVRTETGDPVRVMIIDDSTVVRGLMTRWLKEEQRMQVVASCNSGEEALRKLDEAKPDVVILDIEMPGMGGVETLPLLLQKQPDLAIIVASTLTRRNAELSLKCLALGAADCMAKPTSTPGSSLVNAQDYRRELITRTRELGIRVQSKRKRNAIGSSPLAMRGVTTAPSQPLKHFSSIVPAGKLRSFSSVRPRVLLIGSSTGGPQALATVIEGIKDILPRIPLLITQHMPVGFTTILAEHLHRISNIPAREPKHGEAIMAGNIYVAPGGQHMRIAQAEGKPIVALSDDPPINYCRPAVDPLFQSAIEAYGPAILGIVLTGMGSDGSKGALDIAQAGGGIIAQDEQTSVVWGMPGATVQLGAPAAVLPLNDIAAIVKKVVLGERL